MIRITDILDKVTENHPDADVDIIDRIGSEDFARLRIGIGGALGDAVDYVLARFDADEEPLMERVIVRAADAIECWITHGAEETMNRYNGPVVT